MFVPKQAGCNICINPFDVVAAGSQPAQVNRNTGMLNPPKIFVEPLQFDVLCGKSKRCVDHDGSRRFRAVIECHRELYQQALTKFDKTSVTRNIYDALCQAGSRFLKHDEKLDTWEEVSPMVARDKIGHALRFANRVSRRKPRQKAKDSTSSVGSSSNGSGSCTSHASASTKLPVPSTQLEPIPIKPLSSQPAAPWPASLTFGGSEASNHTAQADTCIFEPTPLEELFHRDFSQSNYRQALLPSSFAFLTPPESPSKPVASTAFLPMTLHESFALMNGAFMYPDASSSSHTSDGKLFFDQGDLSAEWDFDTEINSVIF